MTGRDVEIPPTKDGIADPLPTPTRRTIRLDSRENGPEGLSNGGFACGVFAGLVGGTARVTLRAPAPLAVDLSATTDGETASVELGGTVIATAQAVEPFVLEPPIRPSFADAWESRRRHPFRGVPHPLSDCVVCGPERIGGLRVTPGPLLADADLLASPFVPTESYTVKGEVRTQAVWGALDCPSYPAAAMRAGRICFLGSLEAHLVRPITGGERLIVVGWTTGVGQRSTRTASAVIDETGVVIASARAVWVEIRDQDAIALSPE